MAHARAWGRRDWAVGVILLVLAIGSATIIAGCGSGGGGGSSSGGLCEQCGLSDGPCMTSVNVIGADAQLLCPSGQTSCDVRLTCFRKLGSAQRRCFPDNGDQMSEQFRCDGERANRSTPVPTSTPTLTPLVTPTSTVPAATATGVTPTPTATPIASPTVTVNTPTPAPTPTSVCGNGIVEGDEECDGTAIDNSGCADDICTCDDFCFDPGGTLSCNADCTVNFSRCTSPDCSF